MQHDEDFKDLFPPVHELAEPARMSLTEKPAADYASVSPGG